MNNDHSRSVQRCGQEGGAQMTRFYDPKDETDLERVEKILRKGGVEYFLRDNKSDGFMKEIHVAEEDVLWAEELLQQTHR